MRGRERVLASAVAARTHPFSYHTRHPMHSTESMASTARTRRVIAALAVVAGVATAGCVPPAPRAGDGEPASDNAPGLGDLPGPDRVWEPQMACDDDGRAYAVALSRSAAGDATLLFATTTASGDAWTVADPAPFGAGPRGRRRPQLALGRPGEVYCAWEDSRSGPVDLFFNRSVDGGVTWLPQDVRVNTNAPGTSHLAAPVVACDDLGRVYAVWRDNRDGFDAFYCNSSRDYGVTWQPRDVRITGIGLGRKDAPQLVCDRSGNLYLAWAELRDGSQRAFFNTSSDGGDTWLLQDIALGDAGGVFAIDVAALEDGTVIAAWVESGAAGHRVSVTRSTNGGRFWDPARVLRGEFADASPPRIVTDSRRFVAVGWAASGGGGGGITVASSSDGGVRFESVTVRATAPLLDPDPHGARRGLEPRFGIACDTAGNVYVAWIDVGAGAAQVSVDRIGAFGRQWMQLHRPFGLSPYAPVTPEPPQLACDDFGHVHLLWNGGDRLHAATSPFYAESGWRHHAF